MIPFDGGDVIDVTLTLDTGGAYADGQVLCDTVELPNAVHLAGLPCLITAIEVFDEDNQGGAIDSIIRPPTSRWAPNG